MTDRIAEIEARRKDFYRDSKDMVISDVDWLFETLEDERDFIQEYIKAAKETKQLLERKIEKLEGLVAEKDNIISKLIPVRVAAKKVEHMLNIEDGYEGYVDTDTAAELAEALAACESIPTESEPEISLPDGSISE